MNTAPVYAHKAACYARYRWDYAPEAIDAILRIAHVSKTTCLADIGAGTGILTRHFAGKVGRLIAIEINDEMRAEAHQTLRGVPDCTILAGSAEDTRLPDHSVDLITVAQAIHWFNPEPTRREFLRILKPGGWLALVRNIGLDREVGEAMAQIMTEENGVNTAWMAAPPYSVPAQFYYGKAPSQAEGADACEAAPLRFNIPFAYPQDWEHFFGALCSASYAPDPDHPAFPRLEQAARGIFERFSQAGWIEVHGETELIIGQMHMPGQAEGHV